MGGYVLLQAPGCRGLLFWRIPGLEKMPDHGPGSIKPVSTVRSGWLRADEQ